MLIRTLRLLLVYFCLFLSHFFGQFCQPCQAQTGIGDTNNPINSLTRPTFPLGKDSGNSVEENWSPATFPSFPNKYLNLPGLTESEREILSQNYFVAVNDHTFKSFTELYQDNRLNGISNIVTADSIIHPFLAFQNNVRLEIINASLHPMMKQLLVAAIKSSMKDYEQVEDAEVKEEIKYNIAFLSVALKILDPSVVINNPGIKQLVESDLTNLNQGKVAYSNIFHRQENFALYEPIGLYESTILSKQFFRAYQWLSKMSLDLIDITRDTSTNNGNEFRRSFLLFQSLAKAKIPSNNSGSHLAYNSVKDAAQANYTKSGFSIWQQIEEIASNLGITTNGTNEPHVIYLSPENIAHAFSSDNNGANIKITSLSEPLSRTRLLLAIRSNAPRQFNPTSIFSLNKKETEKEKRFKFHLFSPLYTPENEISFPGPVIPKDAATGFSLMPVGLLLLQNNGIKWANKILSDSTAKLNEQFASKLLVQQGKSGSNQFWAIYGALSKGYSYKLPLAFQTSHWRTFCLERQAAAWVDNFLAIKRPNDVSPPNNLNASTTSSINSSIRKFGISSWRTSNSFNYLEPAADLYKKMAENENLFETSLSQIGIFPDEYLEQSHDFIRLSKRLSAIARLELEEQFPKIEDQTLLASIDKLLQAIDSPISGNIYAEFKKDEGNLSDNLFSESSGQKETKQDTSNDQVAGVNMGLGLPSTLYIILEYKHNYYLLRGAAYSYYEQCGLQINQKHWQRQIEFGFLEAPFWCQPFQRSNPRPN